MQPSPFFLTLSDLLKVLSGSLVGLIPWAVQTYHNRQKSAIEDAEAIARTDLAQANTRSTELRDLVAVSDGAAKLLTALINSGDVIHDLQKRIFELEQEKLGEDMMRLDLKKAMALLAYNNVRFSDAEHLEVKRMLEVFDEIVEGRRTRGH